MPQPLLPIVQSSDQIAPGAGGLVIPHEQTFVSVFNLATQNYRWQYDEALWDNPENAIAMLYDPMIMEPLYTRMETTASLTWHLEPQDYEDQSLVIAAKDLEERAKKIARMQDFLMALLWGEWFGRAGAQVIYKFWRNKASRQGIVPVKHYPIEGDKLVFKYDGTVGVRVSGVYTSDTTEISDYGRVHYFPPTGPHGREAMVVHRFRSEDQSFLRPWKAGQVMGVGLRERLYWFWALKNQLFGLLADYLKWFAQGLTIYFYEYGNNPAFLEAKQRVEENAGKPFLLWPREREGDPKWNPVQRFDPSSASTNLMQSMIEYFDGTFRRMILGQMMTTKPSPSGLGSNLADVQENTFAAKIRFDSACLADTLTDDFISTINTYTYPGYPCPKWVFEVDSPNVGEIRDSADWYTSKGGEVGSESMRKLLGLPAPKPGESILGQPQGMQPAAVGALPQGVPQIDTQEGGPTDSSQMGSAPTNGGGFQ